MKKCDVVGHPSDCTGDGYAYHEPQTRQVSIYEHVGQAEPAPVKPASNPRHSSKENGHRTPPEIVERARAVLGGFDLDPFSSAEANKMIGAARFFSGISGDTKCILDHEHGPGQTCHGPPEAVDGFWSPWSGRVFCNPPGGKYKNQSNQKRAWFKLVSEYMTCHPNDEGVTSALFVCFSVELLQTTQVKTPKVVQVPYQPSAELPIPLDFPICFPSRRIKYLTPGGEVGTSPPHSSCLVLIPECLPDGSWSNRQLDSFVSAFSDLGRVVVPRVYR